MLASFQSYLGRILIVKESSSIIPILVQDDIPGSPGVNVISPSSHSALVFKSFLTKFRGHLKRISVPCVAGNSESSTTIFKAGSTLVQSAEIFGIFVIDRIFLSVKFRELYSQCILNGYLHSNQYSLYLYKQEIH